MGESSYASVARRADRTNDDNKYRILEEKLIVLHQLSNKLGLGRDPMLSFKQKHM